MSGVLSEEKRAAITLVARHLPIRPGSAYVYCNRETGHWEVLATMPNADGLGSRTRVPVYVAGHSSVAGSVDEAVLARNLWNALSEAGHGS